MELNRFCESIRSLGNFFCKHLTEDQTELYFNELKYRYIIKTAIKAGLIKKKHGGYIPGSNFVDSDYFYNQMCRIYKFNQID